MKPLLAILLAVFISSISYTQNNYVIINNGTWNTNGTWSLGHSPRNGETAIVPRDSIVVVDNNMTVSSDITLKVYGNLNFQVGKLKLSANSVVLLYPGGTITSEQGNSADKIEIGGVSKYTGNQGTLDGPLMANAASTDFDFFPVTLPVKFIDYSIAGFQHSVLVKWTTTEEENILSYFIERSINGSDWQIVGEVQPLNHASTINHYSFRDATKLSGLVYYRVKQVDKGGGSSYTSIKSIRTQSNNSVGLDISVVGRNVILSSSRKWNNKVVVSLFNISGKLMAQQTYDHPLGSIVFEKTNLKGHYVLSVYDGTETKISKQFFFN